MRIQSEENIDLRSEELAIRRASITAMLICALCFVGGYFILPLVFDFPTDIVNSLAFALRASVFILFWVLLGIGMVSWGRRKSIADIQGSAVAPPSPRIAIQVAFLQNTLEQAVLAVGIYLALATLLSGAWLSLIVVAVVMFAFGRVLFLRGYSQGASGRALGMSLTMIPSIMGYILAIILMILRI